MMRLPSLLGGLGLVAVAFALISFLLAVFGIPTELGWILGNLGIGVLLLGTAAAMNFDGLRERLKSGEARRASRYGSTAILGAVLTIAILAMLGFLSERHHKRFDWSEQGVHSLSDQSQKVLAGLEADVEVVGLFAALDAQPIRDLLERYEYASERFKVVDFADPNARPDLLQKYAITPEQLGNGVLRIAIGNESVEVSDVNETTITNAMVKLSRTTEKTVYFLEGHNERAIDGADAAEKEGYGRAAEALRNENYRVEKLLLAAVGEVPENADVVIAAGPTRPLLPQEREALERYVDRGGAVMALVDPRARTNLVEDLERWGVDVGDDVIVDRQLAVFGRATTPFAQQYSPSHDITRDFRDTTLFHMVRSVRALPGGPGDFEEIVFTGENSWAERDLERFFAEGAAELGGDDIAGPVSVVVAGTLPATAVEGREEAVAGRVVVFGDADFASNELLDAYLNRDLFVNATNWLLGDVEAIAVRPNTSRASRFQPTAEQFQRIRVLSLFVLPELLAVIGVITWWSRRRTGA